MFRLAARSHIKARFMLINLVAITMSMSSRMNLAPLLLLLAVFFIGTCCCQLVITPRDCPPNETFLPCGPSCQTECSTLGQPCLIRHIRCPDGCYCNDGYARDSRGTCIPQAKCRRRGGASTY